MDTSPYKVFVSHGSEDGWIARQIAKAIRKVGAGTFLAETTIPKGAEIRRIIHREIAGSAELVAFFTPWSAKRSWVWIEIGAAWALSKPVIAVFYGMTVTDLDDSGQGKAILEDINVVHLNDLDSYLSELRVRVNGVANLADPQFRTPRLKPVRPPTPGGTRGGGAECEEQGSHVRKRCGDRGTPTSPRPGSGAVS